jgi:hypothetical protein
LEEVNFSHFAGRVCRGAAKLQGVKMLGRWHNAVNGTGFSVSEAEDVSAVARWALEYPRTRSGSPSARQAAPLA